MNEKTTPENIVKVLDRIIDRLEGQLYLYRNNLEALQRPMHPCNDKNEIFLNQSKELNDLLNVLDHSLDMRGYYRGEELRQKVGYERS